MKKTTMTIIAALLIGVFGLNVASAETINIGVAWAGKSGMAKRVLKGFEEGIKAMNLDVNIEYKKELASVDELAAVAAQWEKEKHGMVLIRSNAAKWLGNNPPSIPTFIGGCNHPTQLGAVKNLKTPEGNITGVTYFLPVQKQFEIFQAILPEMDSVMLLTEKDHPSSLIDQAGTKAVTSELGIAYSEASVGSQAEAVAAVEHVVGKVSVIIMGNQAMLMDITEHIVKAAGKTPVVSFSSKPVKIGALGGFVADDNKLGRMLAESVSDVLAKGKPVKDVPVKVDPDPQFYVNATTAQRTGVEIPFEILEAATIIE